MKLYLKMELSIEERYALEKRLGAPLSRQVAETWCETKLRELIVKPEEEEPALVFSGRKGKIRVTLTDKRKKNGKR